MIDTVILKTWGSCYNHTMTTVFILISLLVLSTIGHDFPWAHNFTGLYIFLHGYFQVTQSKKRPFGKNKLVQLHSKPRCPHVFVI
jgi:hypothetical protein